MVAPESALAGPAAALAVPQEQVGVPIPTPVSLAGASGVGPMFEYGPGSNPAYHGSGAVSSITAGSGPTSGDALIPSPNETVGTVDLYTEPSAAFARMNRLWMDKAFMSDPQRDQVVFVDSQRREGVRVRQGADARRYSNLNVVNLNCLLAFQAAKDDVEDDPREVFERYPFDGVVVSETGKDEVHYPEEAKNERMLNMKVRGAIHTYNLFGSNVQMGTKLYAIVRMFNVKDVKYRVSAVNAAGLYTVPAKEDGSEIFAYQVSFFGDHRHRVPPRSALRYVDARGITRYGAYTCLGTAGNTRSQDNTRPDPTGDFPCDVNEVLSMPKFKMFVTPL